MGWKEERDWVEEMTEDWREEREEREDVDVTQEGGARVRVGSGVGAVERERERGGVEVEAWATGGRNESSQKKEDPETQTEGAWTVASQE